MVFNTYKFDDPYAVASVSNAPPLMRWVLSSLDDISRENLDIIKNSFTDDINPLLSNLGLGGLYFKDGKAYYAKVTECWDNNPNAKLGVFMDTGKSSETYSDAETTAFFFPFRFLKI